MIKLDITPSQQDELDYLRFHHPHPNVQKKMEVVYLKSLGTLQHGQICKIAKITPHTLLSYIKQFQSGGIEKLKEINFYRPESELKKHAGKIEDYFRKYPPSTLSEASSMIEKITSIKRSNTQVSKFLKSLGMKLRKVGTIPAKATDGNKKKSSGISWKAR